MRPRSLWGLAGGLLMAVGSVVPSLIPRSGIIQGLLTGVCAALGYGVGTSIGWLLRSHRRPGGRTILSACLLLLVPLWVGRMWQQQVSSLAGTASPPLAWILIAFIVAIVVFCVLLAAARGIRLLTRSLSLGLQKVARPAVAGRVAFAIVGLVCALIVWNLPSIVVTVFRPVFEKMNASTPNGVTPPTSAFVSGGPDSQIPWTALGSQGRAFVSGVTSGDALTTFSGAPAKVPIRVFVGIDSSTSPEDRARLAVSEIERFGGFDRSVIALGTSAGSGTVDPGITVPLEYLLNGDVATVSTQYSILPSFLSILVDQQNSIDATRTVLDAVVARVQKMPPGRRPAVVVFGESLGAYGANGAFTDLAQLQEQTSGALFEGPPNATDLWRALTDARTPGTPEIRPVYGDGRHVRWANVPTDLATPASPFRSPRIVYLQNASDPVVWWSPRLLWQRPDWLAEPRGPGVLPWLPWIPVFTYSGLTGDMINSQGVPAGHGHVYGTDPVVAWADILRPPGWTAADTAALQQHLAN